MSIHFHVNYGGTYGTCKHKHASHQEAVACLEASEREYNSTTRNQQSIADFLVNAQVFAVDAGEERRATPTEMGYTEKEWEERMMELL